MLIHIADGNIPLEDFADLPLYYFIPEILVGHQFLQQF
jgi:hypothetical protein